MSEEVDISSEVGNAVLVCPRCKVRAQQVWTDVTLRLRTTGKSFALHDEASSERPGVMLNGVWNENGSVWYAGHCQGCDRKSLWRNGAVVFPIASAAPAPHPKLPPDVLDLYEEAGQVLPVSRRAGAALVRASLERLLKHLDAEAPARARLDERIARLSGRISTPLQELLDVVRHLGNESLHGADDGDELVIIYLTDSEPGVAELMFDAVNDLVDELIARPEATRGLWDRLPVGVKEQIERKREK